MGGRPLRFPTRAHPLVIRMYKEMRDRGLTQSGMARLSGIGESTLRTWRDGSSPNVVLLEACFNTLGLTLVPTPLTKPN